VTRYRLDPQFYCSYLDSRGVPGKTREIISLSFPVHDFRWRHFRWCNFRWCNFRWRHDPPHNPPQIRGGWCIYTTDVLFLRTTPKSTPGLSSVIKGSDELRPIHTRILWFIFASLFTPPPPPPVFSGVCVTRSLVLCVWCVGHCSSFCTFSFGHCVVCSCSMYRFWLPLWYLHSLLSSLSGFNLVSLVVISIDLLKDVVFMCLFCPVHCIYNCSE
jgi:hypothetical protein